MTDYYYSKNPEVEHTEKNWTFELRGFNFKFTTDNGVFSKNTVDYGSRALLDAVDLSETPAGPILDMGCGYGPIGMTLAKLAPERQIDMVDVNERALGLAQKNCDLNQIQNVAIFESAEYQNVTAQYAAILTNPPIRAGKAVVQNILKGAYDHLLTDGELDVVIQKKQGAPSAKQLMADTFGNVQIIHKDKGYYILQSIKLK
ncbi:16S rRNA methyltransferase [Latilactobacillus sakei]|uniref:class I SAM-dependent methyltransferase n=1 Tax=Latilactobacillus sakei TaxID=1599 RepID=UPI0020735794|nr:class I SAM-dependent methyltransferase [Latilactobacillus sakei]USG07367.1 16S rRNA methyltransferase [Latilactobacillus sakei]USG11044.1 16S rRNA methyltransferase [Latilactobacillus sakei]